ncbi:methionine-S-oxide reductase [Micractinium conductrix]|uniref:peptide-methionine (S)-S-oxide reductase n=1 Tax=Micractinium conductrix TaxID=554055 RepID=A0A2P6V7B5_9CHLO|nr:methionine-S-oxide reductase [Micractinium conductrix]|eukprot:PSC69985.1 methionine-S-oxide reductase [Micractinium conductrix]
MLFGGLFGSKEKREGKNDGVLHWARSAKKGTELAPAEPPEGLAIATVAGGCFWGLELAYQRLPGVVKTSVGYTDGKNPSPTYEEVCGGYTGHTEAVQMYYNPDECTFESILDEFFAKVDPTTLNRQGNDSGTQYRSVIFYHTEEQKAAAEKAVAAVNEQLKNGTFRIRGKKVETTIQPATDYFLAEDYHQQYLSKGGRFNRPQSAEKGSKDPIRCYG